MIFVSFVFILFCYLNYGGLERDLQKFIVYFHLSENLLVYHLYPYGKRWGKGNFSSLETKLFTEQITTRCGFFILDEQSIMLGQRLSMQTKDMECLLLSKGDGKSLKKDDHDGIKQNFI